VILVSLPPPLFQSTALSLAEVRTLSPAALAYIGDAVYELFVRQRCLFPPSRLRTYHQRVVSYVRAETQATIARTWHPHLTQQERAIFKRGRNAALSKPKRIDLETYQQATGLEALIGYLYLTNPSRLQELLQQITFDPQPADPA
jgi:ribonuclease-3 family protein